MSYSDHIFWWAWQCLAPPDVPLCRRRCRLKGSSNCSAYGKSVPPCCTQGPRGIAPWHRGKGMATRRIRGLWMITTKYVLDYYGMSCMDDCGLFMDYMDYYGLLWIHHPLVTLKLRSKTLRLAPRAAPRPFSASSSASSKSQGGLSQWKGWPIPSSL